MEIKKYFEVLKKWKVIFFLTFTTVFLAVMLFTFVSTPVYEATTKLIILPSANVFTNYNDVRNAITSLDNDVVANTYAEVAQSSTVVEAAMSELGFESMAGYQIDSNVESQTSVITITVDGPDPDGVYMLANVVSAQTVEYVADYFEVYYLQQLDKAELPKDPISPNVRLNLILGLILGLGAGVIFSYLGEYFIG